MLMSLIIWDKVESKAINVTKYYNKGKWYMSKYRMPDGTVLTRLV